MDELEAMNLTKQVMSDKTILPVHIDIAQAWLLISGLQLCTRHPGLSVHMRTALEEIGRQFQNSITELHPEASALIEAGWDWSFDVITCPKCRGDHVEKNLITGMCECQSCSHRFEDYTKP